MMGRGSTDWMDIVVEVDRSEEIQNLQLLATLDVLAERLMDGVLGRVMTAQTVRVRQQVVVDGESRGHL